MKLKEYYEYKLTDREKEFLDSFIEVYDLKDLVEKETAGEFKPLILDKVAILKNDRGVGVLCDYEACGVDKYTPFYFSNPSTEFEIECVPPDEEMADGTIKMFIAANEEDNIKKKIVDIMDEAPVTDMKASDFFTKAQYNDRCNTNFKELVEYLDRIGYFNHRVDAGLESHRRKPIKEDLDKLSLEIANLEPEDLQLLLHSPMTRAELNCLSEIANLKKLDNTELQNILDRYQYSIGQDLIRAISKLLELKEDVEADKKIVIKPDSEMVHIDIEDKSEVGEEGHPIEKGLSRPGAIKIHEGRYSDIQKRIAEETKRLKQLKAKASTLPDGDELYDLLDTIADLEQSIGEMEGELAEIRYIDNGSASDYSGYESLEEGNKSKEDIAWEVADEYGTRSHPLTNSWDEDVIWLRDEIAKRANISKEEARQLMISELAWDEADLEVLDESLKETKDCEVKEFDSSEEAKKYFDEHSTEFPDGTVMYDNKIYFPKESKVNEDIEKHDTLNPLLFDEEELKPEIKEAVEKIVNEFVSELAEDEIKFNLKDIVLLGSNASYNYNKDSDLDVHLIIDSTSLDCPKELQDKLYGAYRSIFNKNYDITIKDIPVEIFVELDEPRAKSNGIYSLNNGWLKKPEAQAIPEIDKEAFDKLFKEWEDKYKVLIGEKDA